MFPIISSIPLYVRKAATVLIGTAARRREVEASRRRLVAAVNAAQSALVVLADRAAEHEALLRSSGESQGDDLAVDGGALTAWVMYRVAVSRSGPGDRLAGHLRYFAGRRFLDGRPDGLLRGVSLPGEGRAARAARPP